jgi:hypothetical protein
MYVCMNVCMYVWILKDYLSLSLSLSLSVCMYTCCFLETDEFAYMGRVCLHACMYHVYACMYVCTVMSLNT